MGVQLKVLLCAFAGLFAVGEDLRLFAAPEVEIKQELVEKLAVELAPKVNLFAEVWKYDPKAMFFGGTSRDFIYWILGKLREAKTPDELRQKVKALRELEFIDIKEFIGIESDIDIISEIAPKIPESRFGVKKLDFIPPSRFDPATEMGRAETEQGHIPVEKIQISKEKVETREGFGDGVAEILSGNLTIHFSPDEVFRQSYWAKKDLNHPVLLAVRYLRIRAMHWYRLHGKERPNKLELLNFDHETQAKIRQIFEGAKTDQRFVNLLKQEQGLKWLNGSVIKAFRSYTNPTAAHMLFSALGFRELQAFFPEIASINQFLFIPDRNAKAISTNFKKFKRRPKTIFTPARSLLPDLKLLHGTPTEAGFRGIVFQDVIPSENGSAGSGLYAVDSSQLEFASNWRGASRDRVVAFEIAEDAKIIDISKGPGEELFKAWKEKNGETYDAFAEAFGADILKYPYKPAAYAVKNAKVLVSRRGLVRELMPASKVMAISQKVDSIEAFERLIEIIDWNAFSDSEAKIILGAINPSMFDELTLEVAKKSRLPSELLFRLVRLLKPSVRMTYAREVLKSRANTELTRPWSEIFFDFSKENLGFYSELIDYMVESGQGLPWLLKNVLIADLGEKFFGDRLDQWMNKVLETGKWDIEIIRCLRSQDTLQTDRNSPLFAPQTTLPQSLLWRGMRWLDKIVMRGEQDEFILGNGVLLLESKDPPDKGLPWKMNKIYSKWMEHFLSSPNPRPELILHLAVGVKEANTFGQVLWAVARTTPWMTKLSKHRSLSEKVKKKFVRSVVKWRIFSPEIFNFLLKEIRHSPIPLNDIVTYLSMDTPRGANTQKMIAQMMRAWFEAFMGSDISEPGGELRNYFVRSISVGHQIDPEAFEELMELFKLPGMFRRASDVLVRLLKHQGLASEAAQDVAIKFLRDLGGPEGWTEYTCGAEFSYTGTIQELLRVMIENQKISPKFSQELDAIFRDMPDLIRFAPPLAILSYTCGDALVQLKRQPG